MASATTDCTVKTVGIIGCGSIGGRYARCLSEEGISVALFDTDKSKAASVRRDLVANNLPAPMVRDSVDELIESDLAFVIVATPPAHHAEAAQRVIKSRIPLLCEKPLAHSLVDAEHILTAAADAKAFGVCNMRFHPAVQVLKEAMPRIGKPLVVRAHFGHRLAQMRPQGVDVFASSYAEGGGVVLDCVHELDYLSWLFGSLEPQNHMAAQIGAEPISAEDWAAAVLQSSSGTRVELHLNFLSRYKRRGCEIVGTDGSLVWQSLGRRPERASVYLETTDAQELLWESPSVNPDTEYLDMLRAMLAGSDSMQTIETAYEVAALAMQLRRMSKVGST